MATTSFEGSKLQRDLQKAGVKPLDQKYLDSQLRKDVEAGRVLISTDVRRVRGGETTPSTTVAPATTPVSVPEPTPIAKAYTPPPITERLKTIPGYVKTARIGDEGVYATTVGVGQIVRGDVQTRRAIKEQEERESLREFKRELLPYEERGTIRTDFTEDYQVKAQPTVQDIETKATLGEISKKVAVEEISKIKTEQAQQRIDQEFQTRVQPEIEVMERQAQQEIEAYRAELIGRQDITTEEKNRMLEQRASEISKRTERQVQERVKTFNEAVGEQIRQQTEREVRDAERRITIQQNIKKGIVYGGIGAGVGIVATPIAAAAIPAKTAPTISKISTGAFAVGTAATTGYAGLGIAEDWKRGELSALSVASRLSNVAPMISAYAGVRVGSRLVSPKVDPGQLQTAVQTAKIKPKGKPKGITKEADLRKLELTSEGRIEAQQALQRGYTLRKQSYEIYNPTRILNKVLDKGLPIRKIKVVEVIDAQGEVINRIALGRIKLTGGRYLYKEDFIQESVGFRDATGTIRMDTYTTTRTGPATKPVITQRATEELIKTKVDYYKLPTGEIQRIVKAKTATTELGKTYPEQIFKTAELQKLTGVERTAIGLRVDKQPIPFIEQDLTFKPIATAGVGGRVLPPVDAVKIRPPKPFTPPEDVTGISQGLKTIQASQTVLTPPTTDYSRQLTQMVKTAKITPITQVTPPVTTLSPSQALKTASDLEKDFSINVDKISPSIQPILKEKPMEDITTPPVFRTSQPVRITERQIQAQTQVITPATLLKLEQKQIQTITPKMSMPPITPIPLPSIPKFDLPPILPPLRKRAWSPQKLGKALKTRAKRAPAYTASLAAAAVQAKPLKITKKQYEKLKKKVYTGLETRPVVQIKEDKQTKKTVQF